MKTFLFSLLAVTALAASSGCCCLERWWCRPWGCNSGCGGCNDCGGCGGGCDSCGCGGGGFAGGGYAGPYASHPPRQVNNSGGQDAFEDGPPTGQVAYPYYTNRGPRDYLARNPRSIGP